MTKSGVTASDTRYIRAGFLPIQERDASNSVTREYLWGKDLGGGIGGLLNLRQGGKDYNYLYDGKGNVSALFDINLNTVAVNYTYDPFGVLMKKTGTLDQPFQFSTKQYDPETGLVYYGKRFYMPNIGKWLTRDPAGEEADTNLYRAMGNNPVNWFDPYGLCSANKDKCIQNFLQQYYGDFVAKNLVPEFSAISLFTNFTDYVKGSAISLGAKGIFVGIPWAASYKAATVGTNLAAYPGMAGRSAAALESAAFWRVTAATSGTAIAVGVTGVSAFATAADAYARWICREVE